MSTSFLADLTAQAQAQWNVALQSAHPIIAVGQGTCGIAVGALELQTALQNEAARAGVPAVFWAPGCLGPCYLEPLVLVKRPGEPFGVYGPVPPPEAADFFGKVVVGSNIAEDPRFLGWVPTEATPTGPSVWDHPFFQPQTRLVTRRLGLIHSTELSHYIVHGGLQGLQHALELGPAGVITAIKESGLRGRGGAGFPAGIKWASCADAEGSQKYVVCNADEGNPGAFLNRAQLEGDPFSVLEGMVIAGYATGADRGVIYLRSEYPLARATLERAIDVFLQAGLLGPDVADAGFAFSIELVVGAGAYICGEETALLNSIEGLRPNPRAKTHFPTQRGLYGRPTVINNVETLATVPAVLAIGAEQYARLGTPASHGTKTISLVGSVRRPGLVELEFGASLGTLVNDVGAGTPEGTALLAVHVGGPSGKLMLPDILSSPICYAALNEAGTMLGSGEFFVLSDHDCPLAFAGRYVRFAVDEGCGKCTPCRIGNFRLLEILERLEGGSAHEGDVERMHQLATTIHENAACGLGQTSANPILSVIQNFPDALEKHQNEDGCPLGTPRTAWDHAEVE